MNTGRVLLVLAVALLCVQCGAAKDNQKGERDWKRSGYPACAFLGGFFLVALSIGLGFLYGGTVQPEYRIFAALNTLLLFMGMFLIFGPNQSSLPCATLGLQLFFLTCIAYYTSFTDFYAGKIAYLFVGVFTLLGLMGQLSLFGYGASTSELDHSSCLTYFVAEQTSSLDRCNDTGYLGFLRFVGFFSSLLLATIIGHLFVKLTSSPTRAVAGCYETQKDDNGIVPGSGSGPTSSSSGSAYQDPAALDNSSRIDVPDDRANRMGLAGKRQ